MIPKKIHIVWNHKEVVNSTHPLITNGLLNIIRLNPDWELTVYTPPEIEADLRQVLAEEDYRLVSKRHFVSKIDLWRLFKLYNDGGFYLDIDRPYNIPLSDIIEDGVMWVCPTSQDYDTTCDFLLSSPNNPVFFTAIKMYLQRLREGHTGQYFLGPQTYMHAVTYTVLGEILDTNPGIQKMNIFRDRFKEMPFARTYREIPPNDTVVYKGDIGDKLEVLKRDFYAKEGVKHWTGEW
jgi:mannosyltransferase OCH1-like enzyme